MNKSFLMNNYESSYYRYENSKLSLYSEATRLIRKFLSSWVDILGQAGCSAWGAENDASFFNRNVILLLCDDNDATTVHHFFKIL